MYIYSYTHISFHRRKKRLGTTMIYIIVVPRRPFLLWNCYGNSYIQLKLFQNKVCKKILN